MGEYMGSETDYFEKNIIARLVWVLAPGSAQVHSTQIYIYIKLHEGLYGLQFVPILNILKYSTISCRHVHKMYSIVQLGPSPFCQTLREKHHKALKSLLLNKWMQRRQSPNPLQLDL